MAKFMAKAVVLTFLWLCYLVGTIVVGIVFMVMRDPLMTWQDIIEMLVRRAIPIFGSIIVLVTLCAWSMFPIDKEYWKIKAMMFGVLTSQALVGAWFMSLSRPTMISVMAQAVSVVNGVMSILVMIGFYGYANLCFKRDVQTLFRSACEARSVLYLDGIRYVGEDASKPSRRCR